MRVLVCLRFTTLYFILHIIIHSKILYVVLCWTKLSCHISRKIRCERNKNEQANKHVRASTRAYKTNLRLKCVKLLMISMSFHFINITRFWAFRISGCGRKGQFASIAAALYKIHNTILFTFHCHCNKFRTQCVYESSQSIPSGNSN